MHQDVDRILVTQEEIVAKCKQLGEQISRDYRATNEIPLLVALLKGSIPFLAELIKYIDLDIEFDFMDVSSYEGTKSLGDIKVNKDLDSPIQGRPILLVEDIIDTGQTLTEVARILENKGAKNVKVVTMLDKPERRIVEFNAEYVGFNIPNEFVIGYGLDYDQKYRNLPYIGVLKRSIYE